MINIKCEIIIDKEHEEGVWVYLKERTRLASEIEELILGSSYEVWGYNGREIELIDTSKVDCFITEDNRIFALIDEKKLLVKLRLYQLEEILGKRFVKINQSCIANIDKIEKFDASFSGTLMVMFKNGHRDYVSRRQLKTVKERLGF